MMNLKGSTRCTASTTLNNRPKSKPKPTVRKKQQNIFLEESAFFLLPQNIQNKFRLEFEWQQIIRKMEMAEGVALPDNVSMKTHSR